MMSTTQDEQTLIHFPSHYQMQNILLVPSQKAVTNKKLKPPQDTPGFQGVS